MTEQSPAVRENKNQLLDDVYGRLTAAIAADRTRAGHPMDAAIVRAPHRSRHLLGGRRRAGRPRSTPWPPKGIWRPFVQHALGRANLRLRDPDRVAAAPAAWPSRRVAVLFVDGTMVDGPNVEAALRDGRLRRLRHAGRGARAVPPRPHHRRGRPAREQPGRLGLRLGRPGARDQEGARGRQADRRLDGRSGGLGRLLHRRAGRRHLRGALDDDRVDRCLRLQGRRAEAARHAGDQRRDLSPRRPRRLPVALPALDRRGARAGRAADSAPLPAVRGHRGRRAPQRAGSPPRGSTSSAGGTSGPARRRRGWAWSTGWAASRRRSTRRRAWAACRSGATSCRTWRCCRSSRRASCAGWRARRRCSKATVGAADAQAFGRTTSARRIGRTEPALAQPASLLTGDARAALRLLAPFLVQGNGAGFAARLPYDIDLR